MSDTTEKIRVLIVDDVAETRDILEKSLYFESDIAVVGKAANGLEALQLAKLHHPHVVLMDINMPVMDGIEATLALRADPATRDVPIFALTGDVSVINQRRIGEAGVDGYLEKPVAWDTLKQTLASLKAQA